MPRKLFDTTQLQQRLNEYIAELNDIYTKASDVESYARFCEAIFRIKALTDYFYTPDSEGRLPAVDHKSKLEFAKAYNDAIEEAKAFDGIEDTGEVAMNMKNIASELLPLLRSDQDALSQVDEKKSMPLPELITIGRREVVDLGDQAIVTEGGNVNQRLHIKVQNGGITDTGYFTPTMVADPEKDAKEIFLRIAKKYGPKYKPLLKKLYNLDLSVHFKDTYMSWSSADPYLSMEQKNKDEAIEHLEDNWFGAFYNRMKLSDEAEKLVDDPRFHEFSDELFNSLKVAKDHYRQFFGDDKFLNVEKGANIDKRNIAFYRMACLFGKSDMVPETKPMTVVINGKKVTGTFMAEAHGVDILKVKDGDEILSYDDKVYDNPAVFDDIAAMQALDYICGNTDRHSGNFFMRFDPKDAKNAKLVGLSLIDNDMTFSDAKDDDGFESFLQAKDMGVVGYEFYQSMCLMTKEQMHLMLSDCGLSGKEIDMAWDRKEYLRKKIEEDIEYYKDKAPGYTEKGKIRLVKKEEWASYNIKDLANTHRQSQFRYIKGSTESAKGGREMGIQNKLKENKRNEIKKLVGIPVTEKKEDAPIPVGHVVNLEEANLDERDAEVKLIIPSLSQVKKMGNVLSTRYLLSYEEDGVTKEVFFTPEQNSGLRSTFMQIVDSAIEDHPGYKDVLSGYRDLYLSKRRNEYKSLPSIPPDIPYEKIGISKERAGELNSDKAFDKVLHDIVTGVFNIINRNDFSEKYGMRLDKGRRLELRNVAMSDVSDSLGLGGLLAKSKTVKVMCGGRIIEGVAMDKADGYDLGTVLDHGNHPMASIPVDKIDEVYNTPEGLKSLADIYIVDYICLNPDRHENNMMYRFSGMDTGNPRFLGVVGIDHDTSFGDKVPKDDKRTNKLCPIDSMKVISKEIADEITKPGYFDELSKKLKTRGLADSELKAVRDRVEKINERIADGRMRVVARDEWAKGDNTLEKLSAHDDSIFEMVRIKAFEEASNLGQTFRSKKRNKNAKPYVEKELEFTKCVRVDEFGKNAIKSEELKKLEHKAEREFNDRINLAVFSAPSDKKLTDREIIEKTEQESKKLMKLLSDADPTFSFTSKTYKELRKAAKELHELSEKLKKKYKDPDTVMSVKDSNKLTDALNKVLDKSEAYNLKKVAEMERGEEISVNGQARMQAATRTSSVVNGIKSAFKSTVIARNAAKDPIKVIRIRMEAAQSALSGKTGKALYEKVAEVLFFKGFLRIDRENKKTASAKNAIDPAHVKAEVEGIMNTPGFKELTKLSEDKLRAMAATKDPEKLLKQYIKETAKTMKQANDNAKRQALRQRQNAPANPQAGK